MNRVALTGRLTKDIELKATGTGTEVCNFMVAVDRRYKKQGEEKQADFIPVVAWAKTAVFINTYFHKGDGIVIEGRLESRKYADKEGNNRVAYEVIAENVEFPINKPQGNVAHVNSFVEADEGELPF